MVRSQKHRKGWADRPTALVAALFIGMMAFLGVGTAHAVGSAFPLHVTAGQSLVLETKGEVTTVSIADPRIADAAVGSQKTVVVNGKAPGYTSLVVWEEGGNYTLYQIICTDPGKRDQVLLKVRIGEINTTRAKQIGMDWTAYYRSAKHLDGALAGGLFASKIESPNDPPLLGPNTDGFIAYRKTDGSFQFLSAFHALEEKGIARTLANPNLVALSGDSASFIAGGEFPVPITRSSSDNTVAFTIEWKQFGIRLQFIPTVLDSNRIQLYVEPEVSAPDYSRAVLLAGTVIPGITTRRVSTTVELRSGEVLVIGGVKSTEELKVTRKFPILGEIPILNLLFKHSSTDKLERDLVMIVSPEIIGRPGRSWPAPIPGEKGYGEPQGGETTGAKRTN
ncbi:MAG TPA: pilus assembly protein N-terminal domain-containing protein [Candidatus Eisenbacteria bacterium]|nr:pilus assembly protein N-terminal domain-containing protein [Candidatus Eisenbacteria bacterium]